MHETSLARDILDVVVKAAEAEGANEVKGVHLTIGDGRDVVPHIFRELFRRLAVGTPAEGAEITIDRRPIRVRCLECDRTYPVNLFDQDTWKCPRCGSEKRALHSGMEFTVDFIETT